jgi:large subunit ribosomal protein L25
MSITLAVQARGNESAESLRAGGLVPAVFYGPKEQSTPVAIEARAFERALREAGETTIVTLTGVGDAKDTLIHDVQTDPVSGIPLHVDFYVLEKGKKVTINVPLEFEGTAPAEKVGGVLVKALHEVEIEVAPAQLPHSLSIDLSVLENIGDRILAKDIALPTSATLITDGDEIVASVTEAKEEETEAPAPADTAAAPVAESSEAKSE